MAQLVLPAKTKHRHQASARELPAELIQARRFSKTRSAQSIALSEDYAELIADLLISAGEARPTDIARRLGVSHATAIKTVSHLKAGRIGERSSVSRDILDRESHALAERVRARHRLVVDLLRAVGVPAESAEADAEGTEHYVSETTLQAFSRFLRAHS